jgi:guanine deaminase
MKKIYKTSILSSLNPFEVELKKNVFLEIEDEKIQNITTEQPSNETFEDKTDCLCIPGFIDTHVHLSQLRIRGKHSPNLLHWLNTYTFQEELRSSDKQYAKEIAFAFFSELKAKGTTAAVIYVAPFSTACEIAFQTAEELNFRAIIGMTMMDRNCPDYLCQDTKKAFEDSVKLYEKWNGKTTKLEYVFTPRFAPTCSRELMRLTGDFASQNKAFIQTHLSENKAEIDWVLELFPECKSYTEVYEKYNLLTEKTLLGHGIHLSDSELDIIKAHQSKITHCPDSNFFLKSGSFPLQKVRDKQIDFALASDVGGGTSLSMLNVMKMCNYRQDDYLVSPEEAFYYATLGAAKIIGKEDIIGSIETGKAADIVFLSMPDIDNIDKNTILSRMYYLGDEIKIIEE